MPVRRPTGLRAPALLALGLLLLHPTPASPAGTRLPAAPSSPPGRPAAAPIDPLAVARERWSQGDAAGVITVLEPWLAQKKGPTGRTRAAASLVLGKAHAERGNHNLASQYFNAVRRQGGALAPYGAFFEAEADLARGRPESAARTCGGYAQTWPEGPHLHECTLLMGDAYAQAGNRGAAAGAYQRYLKEHPESPREEEIRLNIALAHARSEPAAGARELIELALNHGWPSTDLAIQAELERLRAAGVAAAIPTDARSRMRRAGTLRRSGRFEEAWEAFEALRADAAASPPRGMSPAEAAEVLSWVDESGDNFAWATRKYDVFVESVIAQYNTKPSGDLAWEIFKTYGRFGEWPKAMEWIRRAEKDHPNTAKLRSGATDIAWGALHAGEYGDAAARWLALSKRGGGGPNALFYSAFALGQAGQHTEAVARFDQLAAEAKGTPARVCYWRAKSKAALGDAAGAEADRACAIANDKTGWYGLLLAPERQFAATPAWTLRDGRWHGPAAHRLAPLPAPIAAAPAALHPLPAEVPVVLVGEQLRPALLAPDRRADLSGLRWDVVRAPVEATPPAASARALVAAPALTPLPDSYGACRYYDPKAAAAEFLSFAERNRAIWKDLPAAWDLSQAGLSTEAARLTYAAYEEWLDVTTKGAGGDARRQAIAKLGMSASDWRPYVLFSRDHYHVARVCSGLSAPGASAEEERAVARLGWPVVRPDEIWAHAQTFDVDPWVMLGLMRQESTYRNTALSPVGAIGLVQVMPRTGARVAAMLGEQRYSPGDLEDPAVNLRYGIFYFSKLLDRFDGVFPLAVASYNGGPHNVSRWYRPLVGKIDLDALVEQMQYDETRDYVKKVSGNYARYVALYEPAGARVVVPLKPAGDHAEIINF